MTSFLIDIREKTNFLFYFRACPEFLTVNPTNSQTNEKRPNKKTEITNIGQELQTPTQSNPEKKRRTEEEHQDSSAFFCLPCPPWEWRSRLRHRAGDASGMAAVGCLER